MINIRKFLIGLGLVPVTSTSIDTKGEMEVLTTGGKLNYHNGTTVSPMVTEAHTATLTNKTIDGGSNTLTALPASALSGTALPAAIVTSSLTTLGTQAQALNLGGFQITNAADPTTAQGLATQAFVLSQIASGVPAKDAVIYATTGALPSLVYANGASGVGATLTGVALAAISIDSASPTVGQRVLIKDQVSTFQNGIYTVTTTGSGIAAFVLTRATDFNTASEVVSGASVFVISGTANANTTWDVNSANVVTMGTDAITFVQTAGPGSIVQGTGITITGNSVALSTPVSVANGGTGDSTLTAHGVLLGEGTSAVVATAVGATNTVLHGNTGADPTFSAIVNADITNATIDLTTKVTGVLPSANVGLGRTINAQTGTTYTFVLADGSGAGGNPLVTASNSSPQTYTVPPNSSVAFPIGTQIDLMQQGAGKVTLAQGSGVTIHSKAGNLSISAQYVGVSLIKTATDTWTLLGDLIA